jgi:hypothetical protein
MPNPRETGLPFLRNYSPREYRAQSQNWAATQDQRGVMYIGNNDGVLVYDGVRWHTVRVANDSAVRSLAVDGNGVVYVGARGEFGYLAPDESGAPHYVSLLDRVPAADRSFKDIWRTLATGCSDGIRKRVLASGSPLPTSALTSPFGLAMHFTCRSPAPA